MPDAAPSGPDRLAAALADRYRIERELGAGGMATVLRAGLVAAALVVIAGIVALGQRQRPATSRGNSTTSVAVLPFADLSSDQANAYLGDGIAETLINALANVPGMQVAARTSAFSFRGGRSDVREIGRGEVPATVLRQAYTAGGPDSMLRVQVQSPGARRNPVDRAMWHVLLGDLDAAFADLDQALQERNVWLGLATAYPLMAPLRADPRYAALRARMGLPVIAAR